MKQFERFAESLKNNSRLIIGLMSGTSADGIDACAVRFFDSGEWSVEGSLFLPYAKDFQKRLIDVASADGQVRELCPLSFEIGCLSAVAVNNLISRCSLKKEDVALVVSHGHTVCHFPGTPVKRGSTLQVGEGAVIAEDTGLPVLEDLRVADVAAYGQGAPLVPAADRMLFYSPGKTIAVQNIGGIGNITCLEGVDSSLHPVKNRRDARVTAFDTGPGNMLIDLAVSDYTNGKMAYDEGGCLGAEGTVNESFVEEMMNHSFIKRVPPKTTGREEFGEQFYETVKIAAQEQGISGKNLISTLTAFTAQTISKGVNDCLKICRTIDALYIAGGGSRNSYLMDCIRNECSGIDVQSLDDFAAGSTACCNVPAGFSLADMREALCFAALGNLYLLGENSTEISVTGAKHNVCSGKLLFPPHFIDPTA